VPITGRGFVGAATVASTASASPIMFGRVVMVAASTSGALGHRRRGAGRSSSNTS
jgi:archaellum component FlaG (FlaF/FlaG flagellin family)